MATNEDRFSELWLFQMAGRGLVQVLLWQLVTGTVFAHTVGQKTFLWYFSMYFQCIHLSQPCSHQSLCYNLLREMTPFIGLL